MATRRKLLCHSLARLQVCLCAVCYADGDVKRRRDGEPDPDAKPNDEQDADAVAEPQFNADTLPIANALAIDDA